MNDDATTQANLQEHWLFVTLKYGEILPYGVPYCHPFRGINCLFLFVTPLSIFCLLQIYVPPMILIPVLNYTLLSFRYSWDH